MKIFFNVFIGLSVLILGSSCKNTQSTITSNLKSENTENSSFVVTYLINIEKKKDDIGNAFYTCTLENQIKKEGFLKLSTGFNHVDGHGHHHEQLLFVFEDKNGQMIEEVEMPNPLIKHFEVPSEDGHIEKKTVHLEQEVIGVRINYQPDISIIQVYMLDEETKEEISSIQLTN